MAIKILTADDLSSDETHLKISLIYFNSILIIIEKLIIIFCCCEKMEKLNFGAVHTLVQICLCASFKSLPVTVYINYFWKIYLRNSESEHSLSLS